MSYDFEAACQAVRDLEAAQSRYAEEIADAKAGVIAAANEAIDEIIRKSGLTYGEILGQPLPQIEAKPARKRNGSGEHPRYALIGDPDFTYARGPVPLWMKREMEIRNLDPSDKQGRQAFRDAYMVQVQP